MKQTLIRFDYTCAAAGKNRARGMSMIRSGAGNGDIVYDQAISLGGSCQPAWHLRKNHLRVASYPLDWLNTRESTEALCTVLRTRFENFFERPDFEMVVTPLGNRPYVNRRTGFWFWHEFEEPLDFEDRFEERRTLYDRRISRMLEVFDRESTVLLVRFRTSRDDASQLADVLRETYPRMRFTILAVDDTDEIREDWNIPDVVNRYIECAPNSEATNTAFDENWTRLFSEFRIANKAPGRWTRLFRKPKLSFLD